MLSCMFDFIFVGETALAWLCVSPVVVVVAVGGGGGGGGDEVLREGSEDLRDDLHAP